MTLTGAARVVGVIGDPIAHSLSPPMHNAAFAALGMEWVYVPFHVRSEALGAAVAGLAALGVVGFNVTVPHKVAIVRYLDDVDPGARLMGAVNTVVRRDGGWTGYNTDGLGFLRSLRTEAGFEPRGRRILLVGAGGAARAVGVQLALEGAERVDVANRTYERAAALAELLRAQTGVAARPYALSELHPAVTQDYDAVVHTTSWGMAPHADVPPLVPADALHPHQLVCDIVYTPEETSLLRAARARGCRVLPGMGMLVHQAAAAFELWTGRTAPVDVMYNELRKCLQRRAQPE